MKLEKLVRDLSLRMIVFLVILILLWAVVLMIGVSFEWSFLTSKVETAFYLGGFIVGLLIFALSFSNITSNLSIISKAQNKEITESKNLFKQMGSMIGLSLSVIVLIVGGLWFAEWKVYQKLSEEAWNTVLTISEKNQFKALAKEIQIDGNIKEILNYRDALSYDVRSNGKLSFLIPKTVAGIKIYYEITPWFHKPSKDKNLSEVDLNRFKPNQRERKEFYLLSQGKLDSFKVPVINQNLRVFYSKKIGDQEIVILLDTSRKLESYNSDR